MVQSTFRHISKFIRTLFMIADDMKHQRDTHETVWCGVAQCWPDWISYLSLHLCFSRSRARVSMMRFLVSDSIVVIFFFFGFFLTVNKSIRITHAHTFDMRHVCIAFDFGASTWQHILSHGQNGKRSNRAIKKGREPTKMIEIQLYCMCVRAFV